MANFNSTQLQTIYKGQLISDELLNELPAEARNAYKEAVEEASLELSEQNSIQIEESSNQVLNDIPQNLIGTTNPVDLISSNLSTNGLKNNLLPDVNAKLSSPIATNLTNLVLDKFKNKLPSGISNLVDFNIFGERVSATSLSAANLGIDLGLSLFSNGVFGRGVSIPPIATNIESVFQSNPAQALETINRQFDSTISRDALAESRNFNIQSAENEEKLITKITGFIDPTATYPTKEYKGRPETNKLAQGEVTGTIVQKKEKDRLKGIQLPNEQSWEQPPVPYKAEYPYNKVIETESGHIIEYDDTPGGERIHIYHRSGTFIEIDANGSMVKRTKGSNYEIVDKNGYISVTGDASLSVKGSIKIYVGGNADIEVDGDTNIKCFNDITMQAAGRVDISATEEINLHSANINIEADVNLNMKGDVNALLTSTDMYLKANNNVFVEAVENYHTKVGASSYLEAVEKINIKSGADTNIQSSVDVNIKSTGDTNIDGDKIYWNSDKAGDADQATESKLSPSSNIGLIGTRKDIVTESIVDPIQPNFLDKPGYKAEDAELPDEATTQAQELKKSGILTDKQAEDPPVALESETPRSSSPGIIMPSESLLAQTFVPENYQLSKHFTLANLSTKTAVSSYKVVAQNGLSYGEIVYNLQGIALNILEPVLALYPNMFVTSAFRAVAGSSSTSDHTKGKAVDMQFKGISKAQYYEIAKKLATQLTYDKLLLEYKTYGTGLPWIHISLDVNAPRKIVLTYLNDKKYGEGLTNLA